MSEHDSLHLQGYKPAEELDEQDVIDGVVGRVKILGKEIRPRPDMAPLVMLRAEHGERLRFEPSFPVAYYGPTATVDWWPGKTQGAPMPDPSI